MGIFSVFTLISLFYAWIGLRTLLEVWRERESLFDARVTVRDRALLDRLAFFGLIPFGVLLHEIGHALATLQVGGEVLQFRWLLFFGYVVPGGSFSPLESWWISLAGNLVGALLGLLALLALGLTLSPARTYLCWSFARLQLFYALVFYPVFSGFTGFGDWATIYSRQGGVWAWVTALVHALLLAGLWAMFRSVRFRGWLVNRYAPTGAAEPGSVVARDPETADDLNRLGAHYAQQGEWRLAERAFREAEQLDPTDQRPVLNRARVEATRGRHDRARALYLRALEMGSSDGMRAHALAGLAEAELEHRRPDEALARIEDALLLRPGDAGLRLLRARIRAALGDEVGAREDLELVAGGADEGLAALAQAELGRTSGQR